MTRPVVYVDCDIPEGMTLQAYRTARCPPAAPPRRGLRALLRRRPAAVRPAPRPDRGAGGG